jgi:hypothetical protein
MTVMTNIAVNAMTDYLKAVGEHNRLIATDPAYRHSEMLEDMRAEMIQAYYPNTLLSHETRQLSQEALLENVPINERNLQREVNQLEAEQIHLRKTIYNALDKMNKLSKKKSDPF